MKKRGINKIDSLIETPESVNLITPKHKQTPSWLGYALPLVASLIITLAVALPISIHLLQGNQNGSEMSGGEKYDGDYINPGASDDSMDQEESNPLEHLVYSNISYSLINPQVDDLNRNYIRVDLSKPTSELLGDKICDVDININPYLFSHGNYTLYHFKNSNSNGVLLVTDGNSRYFYCTDTTSNMPIDLSFSQITNHFGIDAYSFIEVYENQKENGKLLGFTKLTYTFNSDDSLTIANYLKTIESNFSIIEQRNKDYIRDEIGFPKGISYCLVVSDGVDCFPLYYFSQSCDITACRSIFSIKDNDIFAFMDSRIEMDYDPNYSY